MNVLLARIIANKHTTAAAVVFGVLSAGDKIAKAWFPAHAAQIDATFEPLRDLALIYMGMMSGDAGKSPTA